MKILYLSLSLLLGATAIYEVLQGDAPAALIGGAGAVAFGLLSLAVPEED
jgi:hypothetical protein